MAWHGGGGGGLSYCSSDRPLDRGHGAHSMYALFISLLIVNVSSVCWRTGLHFRLIFSSLDRLTLISTHAFSKYYLRLRIIILCASWVHAYLFFLSLSSLLWRPTQFYSEEGVRHEKIGTILFQSTVDIHFQNAHKVQKNYEGSHSVRLFISFISTAYWAYYYNKIMQVIF